MMKQADDTFSDLLNVKIGETTGDLTLTHG